MTRKEYLKKKLLEHLIGPTGSIILHIGIIYAAVHFIVFDTRETSSEVEAKIMEVQEVDLDEILEEIEPDFEPIDIDVDIDMPDMDVDVDVEPDPQDFAQDQPDVDFAALDVMQVDSPLTMQNLFAGRNQGGRAEMLRRFGGNEQTEAAVRRALEWLRINQNDDGSWDHGSRAPAAMTGLGLLTYLAHGETGSSEQYGNTVRRAIRWLINDMDEDGNFQGVGSGNAPVYAQAIAAYAVSEAYAMTRIPRLRDVMDKSIQVVIDGQQPNGGWDYDYEQGSRRDTSISGFNIQGMKAAQLAGTGARGLEESMEKALEDLLTVYNPETHHFGYSRMETRNESMTALACLLFQLAGQPRARPVRDGVRAISDMRVNWDSAPAGAMYTWYYVTQAKFQTGGGTWETWNNTFAPAFVRNQNSDGSWTSPSGRLPRGTAHREVNYGPVYATTLAALSLQVYYRILPTFEVVEDTPEEEEDDEDEVVIQII